MFWIRSTFVRGNDGTFFTIHPKELSVVELLAACCTFLFEMSDGATTAHRNR
jgi:hypothetical protein